MEVKLHRYETEALVQSRSSCKELLKLYLNFKIGQSIGIVISDNMTSKTMSSACFEVNTMKFGL